MPKYEFCIPTVGKAVPAGAEWFHEVKYDGYRLRIERDGDRVRLVTRAEDMTGEALSMDC
jgi:bifunctional non-homologous end joining protein LigD